MPLDVHRVFETNYSVSTLACDHSRANPRGSISGKIRHWNSSLRLHSMITVSWSISYVVVFSQHFGASWTTYNHGRLAKWVRIAVHQVDLV